MHRTDFINIECEARALVSEEQYKAIFEYYSKVSNPKKYITNINTYFDCEDLYLTEHHIVLRARSISDKEYELTLKIKGENGDIEINHLLTLDEYEEFKKSIDIPSKDIKDKLIEYNVDLGRLKLITELKTDRLEVKYDDHLVVIDKNYYRGKIDFNVEIEANDKKSALKYLNFHFKDFGVTYKKGYISKSRRAIYNL